MLTRRLQVLIAPDQYERLRREAERRGATVGAVVREAIDNAVPGDLEQRRTAFDRLMTLRPVEVPDDPDELEAELDAMFDDDA